MATPARARMSIVEPIERAIRSDRVTALAGVLIELGAAGAFAEETLFAPVRGDHHARRLVWRDPADRFVIVAMTWAPDQGAPLHDHGGLWGGEIVVRGAMHEESYRPLESDGARGTRFERTGTSVLRERAVGLVVPPLEYHSYRNASRSVSHTMHVYSGALESCTAYSPADAHWWTGEKTILHYDA